MKSLLENGQVKFVISSGLTIWVFLFGDLHTEAIQALVMLFLMDILTGIIASRFFEGGTINSQAGYRGIKKFLIYFLAISAARFTDITIGAGTVVQTTMIMYIGTNEFISILENIGRMGYGTPKKLLGDIKKLRDSK